MELCRYRGEFTMSPTCLLALRCCLVLYFSSCIFVTMFVRGNFVGVGGILLLKKKTLLICLDCYMCGFGA